MDILGLHVPRFTLSRRLHIPSGAAALCLLWVATGALAQTPAGPGNLVNALTTLTNEGVYKFDALEFDAAAANDAAYNALYPLCANSPATGAPTGNCTGTTALLFAKLRNLEDNANQFLGTGETAYSLRLSPEGLAAALRWTAPEEYAAQGSLATRFANSQASVLASRFSALRFASHSLSLADSDGSDIDINDVVAAANYGALGGGASGDIADATFGRLSIFANGSFGTGDKGPTTFEDAFSFDDTEASVGADYRLFSHWVVGVMAGHTERRVDFNSEQSIVDGKIRGNGQGALAYFQYDGDLFYMNGSVGLQHLSLGTVRRITYPSNNPDVPSVNDTSLSNTGSNTLTASSSAGMTLHWRGFAAEPYLNAQYMHVTINAFTEHSGEGFDFDVGEQHVTSTQLAAGLKLQYALLLPFGVIVPYAYGEYRHEFSDDTARLIDSTYAAVGNTVATGMDLPTDAAPNHYYIVGGGGTIVLKHGLQGFMQYYRVMDYANYTDHVVSGGLRWEF
ncbi:MAG TPA: autotransporter outer membrane beta-barrel domain-containing protein [Steroidobacteraceae bacterium]|nr:autotransporter outer membrane beta-barrel domain-containing protein [Steroidobacteraceae bacterium]